MPKNTKKIELLAPAGNLEKMKTAFAFGADAVYLGVPEFSLRSRINDFDLASIKEGAEYAHKLKKKVYVTINIFAHNDHIKKLPFYVRKLLDMKVDALVISDPGVISEVKKIWPKAEIHLSTQANCINTEAAKFWHKQGIKRIILGRETNITDIADMNKKVPGLELEYFVHGAMCMAYSGRCFLSKYFLDRSANLGDCGQPCRWEFGLVAEGDKEASLILGEEKNGSYILNSRDLCLIEHLDKLSKAGVISFKIEGRTKSAYYVALICGAYREAIDLLNNKKISKKNKEEKLIFLRQELEEKLVNRGFTEGFMFDRGELEQNLESSHVNSAWEFCGQVIDCEPTRKFIANLGKYFHKDKIFVRVHNTLRAGEDIEIIAPPYDIIKIRPEKIWDANTGEELSEAHGGAKTVVLLECPKSVPPLTVLTRKIVK